MLSQTDLQFDEIVKKMTAKGSQLEIGKAVIRNNSYPVFTNIPQNVRDYLQFSNQMHADAEFVVYEGERYTFSQMAKQAHHIAAVLQYDYGIAKGDRVVLACRNYPEWITCYHAIQILGAIAVLLNAWWTPEELGFGIEDSGARLIIADEARMRRISELPRLQQTILVLRADADAARPEQAVRIEDALANRPEETPWFIPVIDPEDDCMILYTSGSTGNPKGSVSTHRGVVSGIFNFLTSSLAMLELMTAAGNPPPPQQVLLVTIPMFHVTGTIPVMLMSFIMGRKMIMMYKWDPGDALRLMEKEGVTYFIGVPTMSHELTLHPDRERYKLEHLVDISAGGGPRPEEHVKLLRDAFPGKWPLLGYGLTETNAIGCINSRQSYLDKPTSTGRASPPLVEMRIADKDGGVLQPRQIGEIEIRTAANFRGYWGQPEATAKALTEDGWFKTGDLGYLDEDGYLFIVDRKKDIIIRSGENISCYEVEAALCANQGIVESCVFGLPDDRKGEIVGAVVYRKPGNNQGPDELLQSLDGKIAKFKKPERLWFSDQNLPRLGSGKIDKVTLRKRYQELHHKEKSA